MLLCCALAHSAVPCLTAPFRLKAGHVLHVSRAPRAVGDLSPACPPSPRNLQSYGYYRGHRRSLSSVSGIGRQLSSYYGGYRGHRRSMMSVGAIGRSLSYYGYRAHH